MALTVCGLLAALAVAGYLAGTAATPGSNPAQTATAGAVSITLPPDWERRRAPGAVAGVRLDESVAAGQKGSDAVLVAGPTLGDSAPAGAPAAGPSEPVRLGRFEAYRRSDTGPAGSARRVVTYSVAATGPQVLVACQTAAAAPRGFMATCERVASTLRIEGARPLSIAAEAERDRRVGQALAELGRRRSASRKALAGARTSGDQARAADRLARAYADAREDMLQAAAAGGSGRLRESAAAVGLVGRAYGDLASAAGRRRGSDYDGARAAVDRAEAALARLLAQRGR